MASDGVDYINAFCQRHVEGALTCEVDAVKGRILRAQRPFEPGDRILCAGILLLVAEAPEHPAYQRLCRLVEDQNFTHEPLWYWCAVCSLCEADSVDCIEEFPKATREQHRQLLHLYHQDATAPSQEASALVAEFWPGRRKKQDLALRLEQLLSIWLLNCFEHSREPHGFSTFFLPSFLSHSCRPNSMWHYDGDNFVLRARQDIPAGTEVTVSYLSEETLLESTARRRSRLMASKHFLCCCSTCMDRIDKVRGFCCPSCRHGEVRLNACTDSPVPSKEGACARCGFLPTRRQSEQLAAQETEVEKRIMDWEERATRAEPEEYLTDAFARQVEKNMNGLFSSHNWLRDKAARQLASYYDATDRPDLALHFAAQSMSFIVQIYPGYSAMHAWSLELQGDLKLRVGKFKKVGQDSVEAGSGKSSTELSNIWREVGPIYAQASEILRVLFGEDHEFHTAMRSKYESLAKVTMKRKSRASRRGSAPTPPGDGGASEPLRGEVDF
mmetsp:Transcript_130121/g.376451  ORF Transcript_130121/g.376451 Transcript_130121/m.376451 type:complete len:499 (+) Transcript_130121:63-1559(+)